MTGERNLFTKLEEKDSSDVSFGDNNKGKIIGRGTVKTNPKINNVSLVKGLKFNLISVRQLCDRGMDDNFKKRECNVLKDEKVFLKAKRMENMYILETDKSSGANSICLASVTNERWLWHRRLGHASMSIMDKLGKRKLVNGLPELKFEKGNVCDSC